jgi:hypothetical protein
MSRAGEPRKLICVSCEESRVSGPGDTVSAPPASAAETLSVDGTQAGAWWAWVLDDATEPIATAATRANVAPARVVLVGIRKTVRIRTRGAKGVGV